MRTEAVLTAIVPGKKENGVFLELEFFQKGKDLSELTVDHGNHYGVVLGVLRHRRIIHPLFTLVEFPRGFVFGNVVHPVGWGERQVAKEGGVLVLLNEAKGFVHDRILGIGSSGTSAVVPGKMNFLAVADQVGRVKAMGVDLIVVSEEQIEAVLFGNSRGIPSTASPLSEAPRGVASFLEKEAMVSSSARRGVPPSFARTDACPACLPVIKLQRKGPQPGELPRPG